MVSHEIHDPKAKYGSINRGGAESFHEYGSINRGGAESFHGVTGHQRLLVITIESPYLLVFISFDDSLCNTR